MLKLFLLPLFIHVFLVMVVGIMSLRARIRAVRQGEAKLHEIATDSSAWPRKVLQLGNNFDNQFQTPMLWYGVSALAVALNKVGMALTILSWLFLVTRLFHSFVHTGTNHVPTRMRVFLFGFFVLVGMWAWLALKVFVQG